MCFIVSSYVLVLHRVGRILQTIDDAYLRSSTHQHPDFYDQAHTKVSFFTMKHTIDPRFLR